MNKEFQKKLNELSKLSGYEKPKKISGSLKLDSRKLCHWKAVSVRPNQCCKKTM